MIYQQSANTKLVKIAKEEMNKEIANLLGDINYNHLVDVGDMTVIELLSCGHEIIDYFSDLLDELLLFLLLPLHLRVGFSISR